MGGVPSNAASARLTRILALMSDRSFMLREGSLLLTPSFVRHDRRRLVAQPTFDGNAWIEDQRQLEGLAGGWPTYELIDVIAVRGDRLVAHHSRVKLGEVAEVEAVNVLQLDEAIEKMELSYYFDPEQLDEAIAELDRLHAALGHDG